MNDIAEVIKQINDMRDALYRNKLWNDGEVLSQAIVKLAALNSFLGDQVAQAELDANTAESLYKATREARKVEMLKDTTEKISVSQAESQAFVDSNELLDEWNKAQHNYKILSIKRTDTNNLVDSMRSRLSFMKKEREQS